jgi:aromatic-L-amino-acid decarboxylase
VRLWAALLDFSDAGWSEGAKVVTDFIPFKSERPLPLDDSGACESTKDRASVLDRLQALERAARPLEPGTHRRRKLLNAVAASAERFLRKVATVKAYEGAAGTGERLLDSPIAERGLPMDDVLRLFEDEAARPGANPASGGHLAYIPGGGIYAAALGDYLAAVTNKYAGVFFAGPGAVRMENQLLRWVADLVGYPAESAGNIASGGSIATLAAVCAARDAHGLTSARVPSAVVYLTEQAHHCIDKALRIAGLAEVQVRRVPMDERFRMRPDALAELIRSDRSAGLEPWLVVASAGATDTGAVDPLDRVADVAERERCWFHVDAAYGGFFLLTGHGRRMLRGIERSSSAVLDPHKGLFLPYGSGIVLVRDSKWLTAAHHATAHYMQDALPDPTELSPADVSPELTKHFRAVRMWLPLKLLGVGPFRSALEEKLLLARYFREAAAALGFEVGAEPDLSIVTFRWVPPGASLEEANALNGRIVEHLLRDGRIFISSTMLDGRFTLRCAVLGFRTHRRTIDLALRVLRQAVATML